MSTIPVDDDLHSKIKISTALLGYKTQQELVRDAYETFSRLIMFKSLDEFIEWFQDNYYYFDIESIKRKIDKDMFEVITKEDKVRRVALALFPSNAIKFLSRYQKPQILVCPFSFRKRIAKMEIRSLNELRYKNIEGGIGNFVTRKVQIEIKREDKNAQP